MQPYQRYETHYVVGFYDERTKPYRFRVVEPYYDPMEKWTNDPRMQWTLFLYHAPIRIQLRYRTDSAVLMVTKDVWCGVLFVPRVDPRHPRTMGFLSEDLSLAVLVVEV